MGWLRSETFPDLSGVSKSNRASTSLSHNLSGVPSLPNKPGQLILASSHIPLYYSKYKYEVEQMSTTAGTAGLFLKDFPIVCVGGSAGGLDAYTRLLQHLPADLGVAIVMMPIGSHHRKFAHRTEFLSSLKIVMHMCMRGSSASSRS